MSSPGTRLALPLSLLVLAVYLALLPWTSQVWLKTGDEPHYLVAAASLARDGDLDLRNNYDPAVYLDWYSANNLTPQVKTRADGAQFLNHTYGLPFLIAPAFWLGGARGVSIFLTLLGALLAGQVYLLAFQVTGHWRASLLGSLVVAFAPPVIWYVYLIYPELAGALCVLIAIRVLLRDRPTWPNQLALGLSLAALPWLSARFLPVVIVLAALVVWKAIRASSMTTAAGALGHGQGSQRPPMTTTVGAPVRPQGPRHWLTKDVILGPSLVPLLLVLLSLLALALFNAALYSHPAPTAGYAVDLNPTELSGAALLQFARGLLGWLMDHQRGLFVAAPVYLAALVGLGQWLWRREWGALVVALPLAAALGSVAFVGGFWIGVEPAARYLVFVIPPLGAALAYAWVHRRGPWLAALTTATLAFSLWTSAQVLARPLLAQTGDLLGESAAWLVPYLPALGRPTYLAPGPAADSGNLAAPIESAATGPAYWLVPAGQAGTALSQSAIGDFSFGWYQMQLNLGAQGAAPEAPVARVLFRAGDATPLLNTILYGRDFPADGSPATFNFALFNPVYNQWEQPPGVWIFTTGQAPLTLGQVSLLPETFHSLLLPALWLAGLALVGLLVGLNFRPAAAQRPAPAWLGGRALSLAALALAVGAGLWSLRTLPRTFPVADLRHFVGAVSAEAGVPALSAPADAMGVLASTRPEFFPAGRYRWRLNLKAGAAPAGQPVALVRVRWTRAPIANEQIPISAALVPADGQYHALVLEFDNPRRQALVFELNSAAAELSTQGFDVRPLP